MKSFRKIQNRLAGVIGRDCQGKPLKSGDLVEPIGPPERIRPGFACVLTVVGLSDDPCAQVGYLAVANGAGIKVNACPSDLRKIEDGGNASWRQVSKSTGWTPSTVDQPEKVKA